MAKHLTKLDVRAIVNLIRGWQGDKLTWQEICDEAEPLIGKKPTRQSLNAQTAIYEAYTSKKKELQGEKPKERRPASLKVATARIANLESEVAELKERNRRYKELFTVWQYNAYKRGLKEADLNEQLPKIDRERSDGQRR